MNRFPRPLGCPAEQDRDKNAGPDLLVDGSQVFLVGVEDDCGRLVGVFGFYGEGGYLGWEILPFGEGVDVVAHAASSPSMRPRM